MTLQEYISIIENDIADLQGYKNITLDCCDTRELEVLESAYINVLTALKQIKSME